MHAEVRAARAPVRNGRNGRRTAEAPRMRGRETVTGAARWSRWATGQLVAKPPVTARAGDERACRAMASDLIRMPLKPASADVTQARAPRAHETLHDAGHPSRARRGSGQTRSGDHGGERKEAAAGAHRPAAGASILHAALFSRLFQIRGPSPRAIASAQMLARTHLVSENPAFTEAAIWRRPGTVFRRGPAGGEGRHAQIAPRRAQNAEDGAAARGGRQSGFRTPGRPGGRQRPGPRLRIWQIPENGAFRRYPPA